MIEMRDGSDDCLKQYVWGQTYVDELVQIGINDDPTDAGEDLCETYLFALQDANFNVLGLIESDGDLKERYEYTPYGERTVFKSCGSNDVLCGAPLMESQRVEISSVAQAYGLCDIGHQGLLHDKEFGLLHNRARSLHPRLGRFLQRDPIGYEDGMSLYEYVGSSPGTAIDPWGTKTPTTKPTPLITWMKYETNRHPRFGLGIDFDITYGIKVAEAVKKGAAALYQDNWGTTVFKDSFGFAIAELEHKSVDVIPLYGKGEGGKIAAKSSITDTVRTIEYGIIQRHVAEQQAAGSAVCYMDIKEESVASLRGHDQIGVRMVGPKSPKYPKGIRDVLYHPHFHGTGQIFTRATLLIPKMEPIVGYARGGGKIRDVWSIGKPVDGLVVRHQVEIAVDLVRKTVTGKLTWQLPPGTITPEGRLDRTYKGALQTSYR